MKSIHNPIVIDDTRFLHAHGLLRLYLKHQEATIMAQRKPGEQTTFDQVLKLADQLTHEEQDQLVEQMKLQWLRRELKKGQDSLDRGEGIPGDVVLAELRQRAEDRLRKSQQ